MDHVLTARQIFDLLYKCVIQQVTARYSYVIDIIKQYRAADYTAEWELPYQVIDLTAFSQMGSAEHCRIICAPRRSAQSSVVI